MHGRIQSLISNNYEEFTVTVRSFRNHLTNVIKRYKSKTRLEIKNTGLGSEELSENNKQLLEDITERFEESKRRTKVDTQKRQTISKTKKRKPKK